MSETPYQSGGRATLDFGRFIAWVSMKPSGSTFGVLIFDGADQRGRRAEHRGGTR